MRLGVSDSEIRHLHLHRTASAAHTVFFFCYRGVRANMLRDTLPDPLRKKGHFLHMVLLASTREASTGTHLSVVSTIPFRPRRERQLPVRATAPGRTARMALLLLLVLLRFAASAGATAEQPRSPATALFVLGDSTVGCAATTASSILPLNNLTTTTTLPSSLSGGPCLFFREARLRVPDLLAARMGLPSPPPISALNGTATAAARGVNFGGGQLLFYGGGGERGPSSVFLTGAVGQQVRLASETLQLLRLEAAAPPEEPSSSSAPGAAAAVFVLSFGADAYARLLARGPAEAAAAAPKHGRRGFARLLADRVARAVSELYEAGARRVAVMGVPPLGCAPRVMWERTSVSGGGGGGGCVEEANELIQGYNARLAARLDDLRLALAGADVVFCDVYKGMMEIISNPATYGFEETREACCGLGPLRATVGCVSKEMACGAPERHVWWDLYSPSEAADALVANWSWPSSLDGSGAGATSICGPISLQQLAAGSTTTTTPTPAGA